MESIITIFLGIGFIIVPLFAGCFLLFWLGAVGYIIYNASVLVPKHKREYEEILDRIKNNPKDRDLQLEARRIGKWLIAHSPNNTFTEQTLANDLAAVLGTHPGGAGVVKVEITNPGKLQPVDTAEQVEKLGQLFLKGVITAEEFERGKALFLGNPPNIAKKTMETLDDLYRLRQKGALSESEYNVKKWDLLSGKLK